MRLLHDEARDGDGQTRMVAVEVTSQMGGSGGTSHSAFSARGGKGGPQGGRRWEAGFLNADGEDSGGGTCGRGLGTH